MCLLQKALYGLKQSPRAWFHLIAEVLVDFDFEQSESDPCIFIHENHMNGERIYIALETMDLSRSTKINIFSNYSSVMGCGTAILHHTAGHVGQTLLNHRTTSPGGFSRICKQSGRINVCSMCHQARYRICCQSIIPISQQSFICAHIHREVHAPRASWLLIP